jgi:hypothetical protein
MKRLTVICGFLLLIGAVSARADILECMDCSERSVKDANGGHIEASCCNAINGHCYEGDVIKDWDVGSGCRVTAPDEMGFTSCASDKTFDPNCGGGSKTSPSALFEGQNGCVTDQYGWCDISCMSCTSA